MEMTQSVAGAERFTVRRCDRVKVWSGEVRRLCVRAKEMKRTFSFFFGVNKLFYYYDNI